MSIRVQRGSLGSRFSFAIASEQNSFTDQEFAAVPMCQIQHLGIKRNNSKQNKKFITQWLKQ